MFRNLKYLVGMGLILSGCLFEPEQEVKTQEYSIGPECMQKEDSVTWTDSTEVHHFSCKFDPRKLSPKVEIK